MLAQKGAKKAQKEAKKTELSIKKQAKVAAAIQKKIEDQEKRKKVKSNKV